MNRLSRIAITAALFVIIVPFAAHADQGHDDDGDQNHPGWHDNGRHKGWYRHHHHDGDGHDDGDQGNHSGRHDNGWHESWYKHHHHHEDASRWDGHYVCDNDGDDCHWTSGAGADYWHHNGGYDYGAPYSWYQAAPPSSYNLSQRRNWLAARRKRAMYTIKSMRDRGDSAAAGRMAEAVQGLDSQINAIDQKLRRGY